MLSHAYRVPQELQPDWEWYRATDDELTGIPGGRQHHEKGGLFLREIDEG